MLTELAHEVIAYSKDCGYDDVYPEFVADYVRDMPGVDPEDLWEEVNAIFAAAMGG